MTPRLTKIITDSDAFRKENRDGPNTRDLDEPEGFLTPTSPSPWKRKVPDLKLNAIRRHFASLDRSKLNEVNDDIENTWDCGICLETAVDPCVTRCGHLFCHTHITNWLSTRLSCPICETSCTITEDIMRVFEREQLSPLFTPFVESSLPSQPSRSLTGSPLEVNPNKPAGPSSDTAIQPKPPNRIKIFLFDVYTQYAAGALRVLGLAILLAALLPGGFFSPSSHQEQ